MPDSKLGLPTLAFASTADWEAWLAAEPRPSKGAWLKLAKKGSGVPGVSHREAIDAALCHGWIDGQADKFDGSYWLLRFTPRKSRSKWSAINRARALELIAEGRMASAGLAEVEAARKDGRWDAAYAPQSEAVVPKDLRRALDKSPDARRLFDKLDSTNRYAALHRIHDAKKAETRTRRIEKYVAMLGRGETIYPLKAKSGSKDKSPEPPSKRRGVSGRPSNSGRRTRPPEPGGR